MPDYGSTFWPDRLSVWTTWSNPQYALYRGTNYAAQSATNNAPLTFKFDLPYPDAAIITGIQVDVYCGQNGTTSAQKTVGCSLRVLGQTMTAAAQTPPNIVSIPNCQARTFGSAGNLWGRAWTAADLKDASFEVEVTAPSGTGGYTLYVQQVILTIYSDHGVSGRIPTAAANNYGTGPAWGAPTNVYLEDGSGSSVSPGGGTSNYLGANTYGHAVPADAEVIGLRVRAKAYATIASYKLRGEYGLGPPDGTNPTRDGTPIIPVQGSLPNNFTWITTGGITDMWGYPPGSFTPAACNDPAFGPGIRAIYVSGGTGTVYVDQLRTELIYREAAKKISFEHGMSVIENQLANPGFETDASGWVVFGGATVARTTAEKHSGTASGQVTRPAAYAGIYDTYAVTNGQTWRASAWIKAAAGVVTHLWLAALDDPVTVVLGGWDMTVTGNGDWQFVQTPWLTLGQPPASGVCELLRLHVHHDGAASTFYVDDVVLESALRDASVRPAINTDMASDPTDQFWEFSGGGASPPTFTDGKLVATLPQRNHPTDVPYSGVNTGFPGDDYFAFASEGADAFPGIMGVDITLDPGVNGINAIARWIVQPWDWGGQREVQIEFKRDTSGQRFVRASYQLDGISTIYASDLVPVGQDTIRVVIAFDHHAHFAVSGQGGYGWMRFAYSLDGGANYITLAYAGPFWPQAQAKPFGYAQLIAQGDWDGYPIGGGSARFDNFYLAVRGAMRWPVYEGLVAGGLKATLIQSIKPTSIAPPTPVSVSDDFEDGTLDAAKWVAAAGTGTVTETGGRLRITTGAADAGTTLYSHVYSYLSFPLVGMTVTSQIVTWPIDPFSGSGFASILFFEGSSPNVHGVEVVRRMDGYFIIYTYDNGPAVLRYSSTTIAADLNWVRIITGRDDTLVQVSRDGYAWQTLWSGSTPASWLSKVAARLRHVCAEYIGVINSVTNPGFETNTSGWAATSPGVNANITRDTVEHYAGVASCKVDVLTTAAYSGLYMTPYLQNARPGQRWRATARIKAPVGYSPVLAIWALNASSQYISGASTSSVGDGTWKEVVVVLASAPANTTQLHLHITLGGAPSAVGTFYVDEVTLVRGNPPVTAEFDNSSFENDPLGDHRVLAGIHLYPSSIDSTTVVPTGATIKLAGVLRPFGIDNVETFGTPRVPAYVRTTSIVDPDSVGQPTVIRESPILPPQARVEIAWRILLCDQLGVPLEDISSFALDRQLSYRLNRPEVMTFRVPSDHRLINELAPDGRPNLTTIRRTLKAYRQERTADGGTVYVLRFVGWIWQLQDEGDADNAWTSVTAFGPMQRLQRRISVGPSGSRTDANWTNTDGGQIVHTMLSLMNTGAAYVHTGVDTGVRETTAVRTVDLTNMSFAAAIVQLTSAFNGFDVRVNPVDRRDGHFATLDVLARRGTDRPHAILGWGVPPHNVLEASRLFDAETYANEVTLQGATPDVDGARPIQAEAANVTEQQAVGIYRSVESYPDVSNQSFLQALATEELGFRARSREIVALRLQPGRAPEPFSEYDVGDTLRLFVGARQRGGYTGKVRVYGFDLELNNEGQEIVSQLILSPDQG